jgi:hypothetical protein
VRLVNGATQKEVHLKSITKTQRSTRREFPPISKAGFTSCMSWLKQTLAGLSPDPQLLLDGLDEPSIAKATIERDPSDETLMVSVVIVDEKSTTPRSPRFLDLESFAYLRLLMAGGGLLWLNPDGQKGHYWKLNLPDNAGTQSELSMTVLRLVSGAVEDKRTSQFLKPHATGRSPLLTHYDHRRRNIRQPRTQLPTYGTERDPRKAQKINTSRLDANERAVANYASLMDRETKYALPASAFREALSNATMLIDRLPLAQPKARSKSKQ